MLEPETRLPDPPTRAPDVEDDLTGPLLRGDLWIDHYLPHWTTSERSAARYDLDAEGLRLRIDADQLDWRPEDAPMRVSNLQTGLSAGPLGSTRGTHRHREDGLVVRTPASTSLLWAPSAGRVEVTVSASADPDCMLAVWLVGAEHREPQHSGEVCLFEIDADSVGSARPVARCGLKAHHDPRLRTDMTEVVLPVDPGGPHTWTVVWGGGATTIACEGVVLRRLDQAPDYPLVLMVDLFEIGEPRGRYPKTARVHGVRGWDETAVGA